jgi:hypothetical protein
MSPAYDVLIDVLEERRKQDKKWGEQNHPDGTGPDVVWIDRGEHLLDSAAEVRDFFRDRTNSNAESEKLTWLDIALEELAEAFAESDPLELRKELVQAAAVLVAWIECIDRNKRRRRGFNWLSYFHP